MKYRLAIFDFDGTLADSFPWLMSIVDQFAEKFKFKPVDRTEMDMLRGLDARSIFKHHSVPLWKIPVMANSARLLMLESSPEIPLFPGVDQLLQCLSAQGVKIALVTSNSYENACRILGAENTALISFFECGVSVFGKKSKFRKILNKSGVQHSEAFCIGDEIRDIEAARALAIPFGAVSWGYTTLEALQAHGPDTVFTTVDEIAGIFAG